MKTKQKATKATPAKKRYEVFSADERSAIRDYVKEKKAASRRTPGESAADGEGDVLAKIAELPKPDRVMAQRFHAIVKAAAPALVPRLWYGMPAYNLNGKVLCHFQPAVKFKTRYSTIGFSDAARLDDGGMWPVAFALSELTVAGESRIAALVKRAAGR